MAFEMSLSLWSAVIGQAIIDIHREGRVARCRAKAGITLSTRTKKRQNSARLSGTDASDWMRSDASHYGSFIWCCDLLDLNPERVRHEVFGDG